MPTEAFIIGSMPWSIPVILLLLKFAFKLWVGETLDGINFWKAILQSPIDVGFLSLSFVASAIIKSSVIQDNKLVHGNHFAMCFVIFVVYLLIIVVSIVLWKLTPSEITKKDIIKASFVSFINYAITISMLVYGIMLIRPV